MSEPVVPTTEAPQVAQTVRGNGAFLNDDALVVDVKNLNHHFGDSAARSQVLHDNTIAIGPGQLVIMTGPSGSGKTTLLTLIGALRTAQDGHIAVLGRTLTDLDPRELVTIRRGIGFIFQMHNLFESLSAYENVRMATQLVGTPARESRLQASAILGKLGLGHRMDHKPRALSGGQRQRVAVARALVNRPKLILADEPTAALDKEASAIVVDLLRELATRDGSTILMVTHDNRILDAADRIVHMVDGRITSDVWVRETVAICQFLRTIEPFSALTPTELSQVAETMKGRRIVAGEVLIREGDIGEELFLLRIGSCDVVKGPVGEGSPVAVLKAGDFFGERALISGEPRNATVIGREPGLVYTLDKSTFEIALKSSPAFHDQMLQSYFGRS